MKAAIILLITLAPCLVRSFVDRCAFTRFHPRPRTTHKLRSSSIVCGALTDENSNGRNDEWLSTALLVSSFSDGIKPNPEAQDFLMRGLVGTLWKERQDMAEGEVAESALQSPCCGPDLSALKSMEVADAALADLQEDQRPWGELLDSLTEDEQLELRFIYIPTAMYALRSDSTNPPGKQRQRARADGKKRRNDIVKLLSERLGDKVSVLAVTLDLDDASVKQPEGSDDLSRFPTDGKHAISQWKPHFIYVQGGNTFWLYHCIEKGEWGNDIVKACTGENAAVYCGTSAGAIIMGESMETACWKGWDDPSVVPGKETYDDWKGIKGFGLAGNSSYFPHMNGQWQQLVEKKQNELTADDDSKVVYCLRDDQVCYVDGSAKSISVLSCIHEPVAQS